MNKSSLEIYFILLVVLCGAMIGGAKALMSLSVLITVVIVVMAGAKDLSRTYKRNVLEIKDGQPETAQSSKEGVVQPSGSQ